MKLKILLVRNKSCNYLYDIVSIQGNKVHYMHQEVDFEKAAGIIEMYNPCTSAIPQSVLANLK